MYLEDGVGGKIPLEILADQAIGQLRRYKGDTHGV